MTSKTVQVTIASMGSMCSIPVPFDPKPVFGRIRAPVRVTLKGHTYRSTIGSMGGQLFIPLRRSHREAAGVAAGQSVRVRIELDAMERQVELPGDLARALQADAAARAGWDALSYTTRREHVEAIQGARRIETRARRIGKALADARRRRPAARR